MRARFPSSDSRGGRVGFPPSYWVGLCGVDLQAPLPDLSIGGPLPPPCSAGPVPAKISPPPLRCRTALQQTQTTLWTEMVPASRSSGAGAAAAPQRIWYSGRSGAAAVWLLDG